jgi:hypothetical protein
MPKASEHVLTLDLDKRRSVSESFSGDHHYLLGALGANPDSLEELTCEEAFKLAMRRSSKPRLQSITTDSGLVFLNEPECYQPGERA